MHASRMPAVASLKAGPGSTGTAMKRGPLPACNPTGNFEVTAGGGYARSDNSQGTNDYVLQAKTLFRPLETNGWGIGLGLGTVHHPKISPGPNLLGNTYADAPVSFSFDSDRLIVHTNVGWLRDRASGNNNMTWGVGGEFQASPRLLLIAGNLRRPPQPALLADRRTRLHHSQSCPDRYHRRPAVHRPREQPMAFVRNTTDPRKPVLNTG